MTDGKANSNSIKFSHNEYGKLQIPQDKTGFKGVVTLGALIHTSKLICDEGGTMHRQFATDREGLKRADQMAEEALGVIQDITQTIGYLMAYVDQKEVVDAIYKIGWILVALSDLSQEIISASNSFKHPLENMESA